MPEHHRIASEDLITDLQWTCNQTQNTIYETRKKWTCNIDLVEYRVDKEVKEAMHLLHNCRDQQQSNSEYCPMMLQINEIQSNYEIYKSYSKIMTTSLKIKET